uniref:Protein quiver n=2 Tax=Timema TaxID=61471 RepID=A0A7R9D794_TIMCR|nr:unnamed protein product [Timema cristinae]
MAYEGAFKVRILFRNINTEQVNTPVELRFSPDDITDGRSTTHETIQFESYSRVFMGRIGKVELEEVNPHLRERRVENHSGITTPVHPTEIRTSIFPSSAVELNPTSAEVVTNRVDMLRRSSIIFQAFFLLTFSTYLASAIKCYECFPSSGHDCSSVSGSTPKNCTVESVEKTMALVSGAPRSMLGIDEGSFKCLMIKGVEKSGNSKNVSTSILRSCMLPMPSICSMIEEAVALWTKQPSATKLDWNCVVCDKDGCNSSSLLAGSFPALLVAIVVQLLSCYN